MNRKRCPWANSSPMMQAYHDTEWGVPIRDSRQLWECLMLESFQAGLSWEIILRKRDAFREAFVNFDPIKVAAFGPSDIERLINTPAIVRSRAKIEAAIRGAQIFNEMQARSEDFATFCWGLVGGKPLQGAGEVLAQTELSCQVSKELKRRGFKFVGPTIAYAWMQAVGLVNDHALECFRRTETC